MDAARTLIMISVHVHMFQGGIIYILPGAFTNNGMVPASVFDILTRSALTAHSAPGLR